MKLLKIYFNYLLVFYLVFFSASLCALTVKKKCGDGIFETHLFVNKKEDLIQYVLFYKKTNHKREMIYKAAPGLIIKTACVRDKAKKYFLLFQELCGGNGCPEDVYGVFDPIEWKIIFNPKNYQYSGNSKQVDSFLGYSFSSQDYSVYFCCSKERQKLMDLNRSQ